MATMEDRLGFVILTILICITLVSSIPIEDGSSYTVSLRLQNMRHESNRITCKKEEFVSMIPRWGLQNTLEGRLHELTLSDVFKQFECKSMHADQIILHHGTEEINRHNPQWLTGLCAATKGNRSALAIVTKFQQLKYSHGIDSIVDVDKRDLNISQCDPGYLISSIWVQNTIEQRPSIHLLCQLAKEAPMVLVFSKSNSKKSRNYLVNRGTDIFGDGTASHLQQKIKKTIGGRKKRMRDQVDEVQERLMKIKIETPDDVSRTLGLDEIQLNSDPMKFDEHSGLGYKVVKDYDSVLEVERPILIKAHLSKKNLRPTNGRKAIENIEFSPISRKIERLHLIADTLGMTGTKDNLVYGHYGTNRRMGNFEKIAKTFVSSCEDCNMDYMVAPIYGEDNGAYAEYTGGNPNYWEGNAAVPNVKEFHMSMTVEHGEGEQRTKLSFSVRILNVPGCTGSKSKKNNCVSAIFDKNNENISESLLTGRDEVDFINYKATEKAFLDELEIIKMKKMKKDKRSSTETASLALKLIDQDGLRRYYWLVIMT